jgi:hypothetical protein
MEARLLRLSSAVRCGKHFACPELDRGLPCFCRWTCGLLFPDVTSRIPIVASVFDPALHRRDVARIGVPCESSFRGQAERAQTEHALLERLQAEFWLKGSLALR